MAHLDSEHLRTFLAIAEAGSVTGGAERINRSQSAASLQIRQLENVVGKPLFRRHGRGVTLTQAGDRLLPVARRVTQSLDATLADLRGEGLKGKLRIGLPDDHSRSALAAIVADFAARHPDVELEVQCALGAGFGAAVKAGTLDLAVHEVPEPGGDDEVLREDELVWMCRRDRDFDAAEVLPVAVFDRDCWWREAALSGLGSAGRTYRIVFTSARNGEVVGVAQVVDDDEVMLITDGGKVLRCNVSGISTMGRATQGVRVMDLATEENLVAVARLAEGDEPQGN